MQAGTAFWPSHSHFSGATAESNLTELQRLYWIGHKLRPSAAHFNNAFSFTFATPLCPQLLAQAFAETVLQYDVLRTVIEEIDGVPQLCVLATPPAALTHIDLSQELDPVEAAVDWQQEQVKRPFHLTHCLYDSALLKLDDSQYVWFLNLHHLITDASSFFLIAETVLAHYEALRRGMALEPAAKPSFIQYVATLQRQQMSARATKSQVFWQEKLSQKPEHLHFYGRSSAKLSTQVRRWIHQLGPEQTGQLIALANDVDLGSATADLRQFCLTAALFFALLHQLTGNRQLGFVTTIHNRATQTNRQTVGPLMELCPVLVTMDPAETLVSLTQKVAQEMKQLLLHYRYGASQAASDLAMDVMFAFVQRPLLTLDGQTVAQQIIHPGVGSERLGMHVHHLADSGSFELYLDFHQDIFTLAEQKHAQQTLQALIAAALQNPGSSLAKVALPWPQAVDERVQVDFGANGRTRPPYTPPTTPIETELVKIWQDVLAVSPIGVHDDFFALGGESWHAMRFLSQFAATTGQYLPLASLLTASTIAGLVCQMEPAAPPEAIVEIQRGRPENPPLFLIPGAAGNILAMQRLGRHLPPDQTVYSFHMPDLDEKNLPPAQIDQLAPYYLTAMRSVQPEGPYYLGGYSAGGILAYAVAQELRRAGETVAFLAIIDMPAPNPASKLWWQMCHFLAALLSIPAEREAKWYLWGRDWWNRVTYWAVRGLKVWLWQNGRSLQHIWRMPLKQKWVRLQRRIRRQRSPGQLPVLRDMDPASLADPRARMLFALYDQAARAYLPELYEGRVTLLRCPLGYGRKEIRSPYPDYGWRKIARQVDTYVINAKGHLALLQEPTVAEVGQKLQAALAKAQEARKINYERSN